MPPSSSTAKFDTLTPELLEEIKIYQDPVRFAQVMLDLHPRDYQIPILRDKSRRLILRAGRQIGKCVAGSTRVIDAKTGRLVTVEELYRKKPHELGPIVTLNDQYKMAVTANYTVASNGVKEVFRVTTRLGRSVLLTKNHPLLTIDGWRPVEELRPGDRIAVPRSMPFFGNREIADAEVKVLAYATASASKSLAGICFETSDPLVLQDFADACQKIGHVAIRYAGQDGYVIGEESGAGCNPVKDLLTRHGVFGKQDREKTVPDVIFSLSERQVALFLNRLFAGEGWVHVPNGAGRPRGRPKIGFAASSKRLAEDVQHLLLRFGILANVVKCGRGGKTSWKVLISRRRDIEQFAARIGIFGKERQLVEAAQAARRVEDRRHDTVPSGIWNLIERIRSAKDHASSARPARRCAVSRERLKRYAEDLGDEELRCLADSDIYWDEIVSITSEGFQETYDLSVPGTHNFVADDIFVHNTFMLTVLILHHAYTTADAYVLVACPYESHVNKIFQELRRFIKRSPEITRSVVRDKRSPHEIEFGNGSKIVGFTSGAKSGNKGDSTRGQTPTLIILDEVDRMTDEDLDSIMGTRLSNPLGIRIIMASTPTGRRQKFFHWCVTAQGGRVQVPPGRYSNKGWTTYYYPSSVNPNWKVRDPETGLTVEEELRLSGELSEQGWIHEVLAEFGEETTGVFRKVDINNALVAYAYYGKDQAPKKPGIRTMGVDWDKHSDVGTNIVITEYDQDLGKFKIIYREEIPRGEWTFDNAVQRIIKLNELYDPQWIYLDRGYGDYQYETLRKYGQQHPESGLMTKVVAVHFSEHREVIDPVSKTIEKKPAKPFMVNQTELLLSRGKIILNENDRDLVRQFTNYSVVKISQSGVPQYTSVDEHILDAFMLSILAFVEKLPEYTQTIYKPQFTAKLAAVPLATKQRLYQDLIIGAPPEVQSDPHELYDWKLKHNKRLVQSAMSGRFLVTPGRRAIGPSTRRII